MLKVQKFGQLNIYRQILDVELRYKRIKLMYKI